MKVEDWACDDCKHSFIFTQGFKPYIALWCQRPTTPKKGATIQGCSYSRQPDQECGPSGVLWEAHGMGWFRALRWRWSLRRINTLN